MSSNIMEPAGKNPRVIGTLAVVFLAGAAVGALSMQVGIHDKLHRTVSAASTQGQRKGSPNDAVIQRFKTELNLSPDQANMIAMVLEDYQHYYQSLQDQLDDVRATGKNRILQILDPAQRARFEQIMGDLESQIEKKR